MNDDRTDHAHEPHRTLEFIGLRTQATTVGLLQLCAELVKARILDDDAIQRIKNSIHREVTISHSRGHNRAEFEETLRRRLDAIFPSLETQSGGPMSEPSRKWKPRWIRMQGIDRTARSERRR